MATTVSAPTITRSLRRFYAFAWEVRERLQELWDDERGHFISHRDETGEYRQFATEGNMLAILLVLARYFALEDGPVRVGS